MVGLVSSTRHHIEVLAKTEPFLGVTGKIQSKDGVVHLMAEHLRSPNLDLTPKRGGSRDFH